MIRVDVVLAHASRRCMTCATRTHLAGTTSAGAPGGGAAITTMATYKKPFFSGFLWAAAVPPGAGLEEEGCTRSGSPVGEAPSNVSVRPARGDRLVVRTTREKWRDGPQPHPSFIVVWGEVAAVSAGTGVERGGAHSIPPSTSWTAESR